MLPEVYLGWSVATFAIGISGFLLNKGLKCAHYAVGYFFVMMQGAGIFGMLTYHFTMAGF